MIYKFCLVIVFQLRSFLLIMLHDIWAVTTAKYLSFCFLNESNILTLINFSWDLSNNQTVKVYNRLTRHKHHQKPNDCLPLSNSGVFLQPLANRKSQAEEEGLRTGPCSFRSAISTGKY